MTDLKRLPAGDLVIDLRSASPAEVEDGSVFDALIPRLTAMSGQPTVRVWVLHDATARWCDDPAHLERGIRRWLGAAHAQVLSADGADAVVLPPAAVRDARLVAAVQALGLPVYATRPAGGLPVNTVHLDGAVYTAFTSTPLESVALAAPLASAVDRALS